MKTYTHRVAIMETTQIIMDIEAPNDVDSIKKRALEAYYNEEGEQEAGYSFPNSIVIYPWLEEGQTPPQGSLYPHPTQVEIHSDDYDNPSIDEGAVAQKGLRNFFSALKQS